MDIEDIQRELSTFEESDFSGGVDDEMIEQASRALGVPLPPQYKRFLKHFGSGSVSSEEFVGLGGPRHLDAVWLTNELRNRESGSFNRSLIPLRTDGYGNYDCLDTSKQSDGESPVVEWVHDAGTDQNCRILAHSFDDWFVTVLGEIRKLDAGLE